MQKREDTRHQKRISIVKELFSYHFHKNQTISTETKQVIKVLPKLDKLIATFAPEWPIDQIAPMDLAILRLAIYELVFKKKDVPYKVVVDEAVEIAKEFGSESSFEFVNGVLGSVIVKELGIRG